MEPLTTSVMISSVVTYIATKIKENKSVDSLFQDFTAATVNWIRPILLKEDKPREILENLVADPQDDLNQRDISTALERNIRQNPDAQELLEAMYKEIQSKFSAEGKTVISHSKNTVTGNINSGGNTIVGDGNTF